MGCITLFCIIIFYNESWLGAQVSGVSLRRLDTMSVQPENRYSISEVSELLNVPAHRLRQWEERFPPLDPARNRANQRYYTDADVEIVRRIKQLLQHWRADAVPVADRDSWFRERDAARFLARLQDLLKVASQ